jgi:hypothetical protein
MANSGRWLARVAMMLPRMFETALIAETGDFVPGAEAGYCLTQAAGGVYVNGSRADQLIGI